MKGNYLVIDKRVLPEVFEKVVKAKRLIEERKVKDVTEATKTVEISRSVYYKYKDFVFEFSQTDIGKKVTLNLIIEDRKGALSCILNYISNEGGSIITINQGVPMNKIANLSITVDISNLRCDLKNWLNEIEKLEYVGKVEFIAME